MAHDRLAFLPLGGLSVFEGDADKIWVLGGFPRLHWKLGLVALALCLAVVHDFVLGPRAGKPGAAPSIRACASWLARVNVLVVLAIVLLGLGLLR